MHKLFLKRTFSKPSEETKLIKKWDKRIYRMLKSWSPDNDGWIGEVKTESWESFIKTGHA